MTIYQRVLDEQGIAKGKPIGYLSSRNTCTVTGQDLGEGKCQYHVSVVFSLTGYTTVHFRH